MCAVSRLLWHDVLLRTSGECRLIVTRVGAQVLQRCRSTKRLGGRLGVISLR